MQNDAAFVYLRAHRMRGFTLLEVMVSVAIIGLLLALFLPALRAAKDRAYQVQSLSNLRNIGAAFESYTTFFQGRFPAIDSEQSYPYGCGVRISADHWQISHLWPVVLGGHLTWEEEFDVFHSPPSPKRLTDRRCGHPTSYAYSLSFVANPSTWSTEVRAGEMEPQKTWLASVTAATVRFPSGKTLLWDQELPFLGRPIRYVDDDINESCPMLFADLHTEMQTPSNASEPIQNPFLPGTAIGRQRLHNTRNGVRGADYTR